MSKPTIVKGDEIMLFKDGKSLAYATSHTLSQGFGILGRFRNW